MSEQPIQSYEEHSYWSLLSNGTFMFVILFGYPLLKFLLFALWAVIKYFMPYPNLKKRYCSGEKENWAVVTGATDGIGLGFCTVLASQGINTVLISRDQLKLNNTVEYLQSLQKKQSIASQFKTIVFNFEDSHDEAKVDAMMKQMENLDICLLINNVGTALISPAVNQTHKQIVNLINVNSISAAVMCSRFLGRLNTRKQKSGIINISSVAGDRGTPLLSVYSASKSLVNKISEGIVFEYPRIDILNVKPLLVESKMSEKKSSFFVPTSQQCARASLKQLSYQSQTYGTFMHQILGYFTYNLVPDFLYFKLAGRAVKLIFNK